MRASKHRGPGPSHLLITPHHAGNVVGIDPHKRTLTAVVVDARGGIVAGEHFRVSGDGHRALVAWARRFGVVARWGIENATGLGRHTAIFLERRDQDVRDVCPNRTARADRARQRGKSDTLDAERIAREVLAHPLLPRPFKRALDGLAGPDSQQELLALHNRARRSLITSRQHLLNEAEILLSELPLELRAQLPDTKAVRPRLAALARQCPDDGDDAATALRLRLLADYQRRISALVGDERAVCRELATLVAANGSTLDRLCGLSTRSVAELLAETGDARRFTTPGFARFNGSAPIPASSAEGPGQPVRHRYNPGGNRRVNAILHRMAVTQLRCEPRAQALYQRARERGHTNKEARRILKRHLSDVIHRTMLRDIAAQALVTAPHARGPGAVKPQRPTAPTTLTALAGRAPRC
jgi:transposase